MTDEKRELYRVGYKNPPRSSQFVKGQCGNPRGRPKKEKETLESLAYEVLESQLTVNYNGQPMRVTARKAFILKQAHLALEGNTKALIYLEGKAQVAATAHKNGEEAYHSIVDKLDGIHERMQARERELLELGEKTGNWQI